jgi:hypothetical protein
MMTVESGLIAGSAVAAEKSRAALRIAAHVIEIPKTRTNAAHRAAAISAKVMAAIRYRPTPMPHGMRVDTR